LDQPDAAISDKSFFFLEQEAEKNQALFIEIDG